jgi:putative oxidoreductase
MNDSRATWAQQWGITVLRVGTGIVFLLSAGLKLGPFSQGYSGVAEFIGGDLGIPLALPVAVVFMLGEFLCGTALVLGLFTRLVSILLAILMLVDVLLVHPLTYSSFVVGKDPSTESAMVRLVASSALVLTGPGKAALDGILASRIGPPLSRLLL